MKPRINSLRSDEGVSLIFALILITVVAIVTGALLTEGSTNFAATAALRRVAGSAYAADAATKIAINDLVQGQNSGLTSTSTSRLGAVANNTPNGWVYDFNTDGTGCFGMDSSSHALNTLNIPNVYADSQSATGFSATVTCAPVAGTGLLAPGYYVKPQPSTSAFGRALTTVGSSNGADGINLKVLGTGSLPIRGSVASMTTINVTNGPIVSSGTITANTSPCNSGGGGSYTPPCTYGGVTAPPDPGSPLGSLLPTSSGLPYRDPSTEGCSFLAGYYNNGQALSNAVNACTSTPASFASGVYYFDFTDGNPWSINTTVIGGQAATGASIPGRCVSPINSPTTAGVQFVFGNTSRITLGNGAEVELCGPANGGNPPITIYQQQADVAGTSTSLPAATAGTVANPSPLPSKYDSFTPTLLTTLQADLTVAGDSHTASWSAAKAGNSGELDLQNFAGLSAIPNGSTITSAQLKVTYTKSTAGTFTAGVGGQATTTTVAASGSNTDLTTALSAQFAASPGANPFTTTNPVIKLMVGGATAKNDSVTIDAAALTVSYTTPPIRHATGTNTTSTPFLSTGNNFAGAFVVNGASYAPQGYITMGPGNASGSLVAFRWGLDAWGVSFKAQPQQLFGVPLVSIPDNGYGLGSSVTGVDLKVYVCAGSPPCGGPPALTSRVTLTDNVCTVPGGCSTTNMGTVIQNSVDPIPGQRQVNVLSWAEQK